MLAGARKLYFGFVDVELSAYKLVCEVPSEKNPITFRDCSIFQELCATGKRLFGDRSGSR